MSGRMFEQKQSNKSLIFKSEDPQIVTKRLETAFNKRNLEGTPWMLSADDKHGLLKIDYIRLGEDKKPEQVTDHIAFVKSSTPPGEYRWEWLSERKIEEMSGEEEEKRLRLMSEPAAAAQLKQFVLGIYQAKDAILPLGGLEAKSIVSIQGQSISLYKAYQMPTRKNGVTLRCFIDFDDILTSLPYEQTVLSRLFKSLQENPNALYWEAIFKDNMEDRLEVGLRNPANENLRVRAGAIQCLEKLIDIRAEVVLVSQNRAEYMRAQLRAAGIRPEILKQLIILDIKSISAICGELPIGSRVEDVRFFGKDKVIDKYIKDHGMAAMTWIVEHDPEQLAAMKAVIGDNQVSASCPKSDKLKLDPLFWANMEEEAENVIVESAQKGRGVGRALS